MGLWPSRAVDSPAAQHPAAEEEVQRCTLRRRRRGYSGKSGEASSAVWLQVPGAANLKWRAADQGRTVELACDLSENFGPSSTGKTITVASSRGNRNLLQSGLLVSFNAYLKADTDFDAGGLAAFKAWPCANMTLSLEGTTLIVTADVSKPGEPSKSGAHMLLVAGTMGNRQVGKSHVVVTCNLMTNPGESVDHSVLAAHSGLHSTTADDEPSPPSKRRRTHEEDVPSSVDHPATDFTTAFFGGAHDDNHASLEVLATFLEEATSTLDVAVFNLTDNRLARVLLDKHAAGVQVRVLADNGMEEKYKDTTGDLQRLRDAGISVLCDRSDLHMHDKFAVVDGRAVVNGSLNWTTGAVWRNKENIVINRRASMARRFLAEFDRLWTKFGRPPQPRSTFADVGVFEDEIAVLFFPDLDDANLKIFVDELKSAKVSLCICLFVLTLPEVVRALCAAHARGCTVRVIIDDHMATTHRGKHVKALRDTGIEVRTDESSAQMHHKFGVIDGRTLINGSFNWTRQAEDGNNENTIIYRNRPELAARFVAEFEDLWREFS